MALTHTEEGKKHKLTGFRPRQTHIHLGSLRQSTGENQFNQQDHTSFYTFNLSGPVLCADRTVLVTVLLSGV